MSVLLPVLTAVVGDRSERGYLAMVAFTREVTELPLETAPIDSSAHALEIRVDGDADIEPLVVMAEPMGGPTAKGFPLRLAPFDDEHAAALQRMLFGGSTSSSPPANFKDTNVDTDLVRPSHAPTLSDFKRSGHAPNMTAEHAASLVRSPEGTTRLRAPGSLAGRTFGDGRFVLEALLGGGSSGEVYRATHTALRRPIAVKVLHPALQHNPEYCTRFYTEALAASRLDHPNVLRVIDYGQEQDGLLYIAMELLEGQNLEQILVSTGPLPFERLVPLMIQACAGLAHAHDTGLVHRDIKPENIVVMQRLSDDGKPEDFVKVCDFGIAHWDVQPQSEIGDDDVTLVNRPDASKVVGTPLYMAPEQIQNDRVDARTDVYALGVVMYELATGRAPFDSPRMLEVLRMHLQDPVPPPSTVDPRIHRGLERVILRALSKNPDDRHVNARTLRTDLRGLLEPSGGPAFPSMRPREDSHRFLDAANFSHRAGPLAELEQADLGTRLANLPLVGQALQTALGTGDAAAARRIITWLEQRLKAPHIEEKEVDLVERALRMVRDPQPVGVFVDRVIAPKQGEPVSRDDDVFHVLAAAGPVAARSLLAARRRLHAGLELRGRFVMLVRAVGHASLPVLVEALGAVAGLASWHEEALAEDLLASIPDGRSDTAGEVTVRFVRTDKPALGSMALRVTAGLWGVRAQSLLLGVLDSPIDELRVVAVEMLELYGKVDDWAIERLVRIVDTPSSPQELRCRAASALAFAAPESRGNALMFLHQRLDPANQNMMSAMLHKLGSKEPAALVLALARSLATLDPPGAHPLLQRLAVARGDLRSPIEALLRGSG